MAEVITFAELLSAGTLVAILGLGWQILRARRADQREREERIRRRTELDSDFEHRLKSLEDDRLEHQTKLDQLMTKLDELKTALTKMAAKWEGKT